jgi:hypothetical protein
MLLLIQLLTTGNDPKSTPFNPLIVVRRYKNMNKWDGSPFRLQEENTIVMAPYSPFTLRLDAEAESGNLY